MASSSRGEAHLQQPCHNALKGAATEWDIASLNLPCAAAGNDKQMCAVTRMLIDRARV